MSYQNQFYISYSNKRKLDSLGSLGLSPEQFEKTKELIRLWLWKDCFSKMNANSQVNSNYRSKQNKSCLKLPILSSKSKGRESLLHCGSKWLSKLKWLNKQTIICHQFNQVRTLWLSTLSERKMFDAFHNKYPFIKCADMNKKDVLPRSFTEKSWQEIF